MNFFFKNILKIKSKLTNIREWKYQYRQLDIVVVHPVAIRKWTNIKSRPNKINFYSQEIFFLFIITELIFFSFLCRSAINASASCCVQNVRVACAIFNKVGRFWSGRLFVILASIFASGWRFLYFTKQ